MKQAETVLYFEISLKIYVFFDFQKGGEKVGLLKKRKVSAVSVFLMLFLLLFSGLFATEKAQAQNNKPFNFSAAYTEKECEQLVFLAENKDMDWVYSACGFQDKKKIEKKWELFSRRHNLKKALFNLCKQDINNDFYFLNCRKSADLGGKDALKLMADRAYNNGYYKEAYDLYLKIIQDNELIKRGAVLSSEDLIVVDSYFKLAVLLLQGEKEEEEEATPPSKEAEETAFQYLKIALQFDHKEAAKVYGLYTLLGLSEQQPQNITEGQRYLFRSILQDCPLAQEALAYPYLIKTQKITKNEMAERLSNTLFVCSSSVFQQNQESEPLPETFVQKTQEQCRCDDLKGIYRNIREKPFRVLQIQGDRAVLDAHFGQELLVKVGSQLPDGFEVTEIRQKVVIIRKPGERLILSLSPYQECLDVCFENLGVIRLSTSVSLKNPYKISFTPFECRQLAYYANEFISGNEDFFGKKECRFKEAQIWEDYFKEKNYQRMIYLLNPFEGNYPSALLNRAKEIYQTDFTNRQNEFREMIAQVAAEKPLDRQAHFDQAEAYCLNGMVNLLPPLTRKKVDAAYEWNRRGLQKGFPHSINLIAIQYAKGIGVDQDLQLAKQLFQKADDLYHAPFFSARHNLNILEKGGSLDNLDYGKCADYGTKPKQDASYFQKIKEIYLDKKTIEPDASTQDDQN